MHVYGGSASKKSFFFELQSRGIIARSSRMSSRRRTAWLSPSAPASYHPIGYRSYSAIHPIQLVYSRYSRSYRSYRTIGLLYRIFTEMDGSGNHDGKLSKSEFEAKILTEKESLERSLKAAPLGKSPSHVLLIQLQETHPR